VGETVSFAQIKEEELFDARDTKPSSWWLLALVALLGDLRDKLANYGSAKLVRFR
jgi:hypothetical protein